jgi:long-chain acyl-CoA synthetase
MLYTSGTTGTRRASVLSHEQPHQSEPSAYASWRLSDEDEVLAYLPMAVDGTERLLVRRSRMVGGLPRATALESAETVSTDMREIGPTYYFAPPRVLEGLLTQVTIRMEDASG